MPNIKLQSNDNVIFETDLQIVECSGTIKQILEDCGMEDDGDTVVALPNINSDTLRKILEWANYHKDDPKPAEEDKSKGKISSWDADFLKVDKVTLFALTNAASYLGIDALKRVACETIAVNMIKGKTPEEIRQTLNLK